MSFKIVLMGVSELIPLCCAMLQSLVKSVRVEATQKMTFSAKLLCNNHTINSRVLKNI